MLFSDKKIENTRIKIKTNRTPLEKYINTAYKGEGYEELLLETATAINLNHTSLYVAEKLYDSLPEDIWDNPKVYKLKILNLFGDSGFLEKFLIRKLMDNVHMIQKFPDYGQRVFHIVHNMIFSVAKTNASAYWLRKVVYYSADATITGADGNYPALFHGNLFTRGDDADKLESYQRYGNIKSPYIEGSFGENSIFNYPLLDWTMEGRDTKEFLVHVLWDVFTNKEYKTREELLNSSEEIQKEYGDIMEKIKDKLDGYFDIVIGNPPYNLNDEDTGKVGSTVYQLFCLAAQDLNPKYSSFIIPSKWMYGKAQGKFMTAFAQRIFEENKLSYLELIDGKKAFPSVNTGELSIYTLDYNKEDEGFSFVDHGEKHEIDDKFSVLSEMRPGRFIFRGMNSIINKVVSKMDKFLSEDTKSVRYKSGVIYNVHGDDTLANDGAGLHFSNTKVKGPGWEEGDELIPRATLDYSLEKDEEYSIKCYIPRFSLWKNKEYPNTEDDKKISHVFLKKDDIQNFEDSDRHYLFTTRRYNYNSFLLSYPYNSFISEPGEVTASLFAIAHSVEDKETLERIQKFLKTRFVTYIIQKDAASHNFSASSLIHVPYMDFSKEWTDEELNEYFELTEDEIREINETWNKFKPMTGEEIEYVDIDNNEESEDDIDE